MAQRGKKIDEQDRQLILRLARLSKTPTQIAREAGVSRPTAYKYSVEEKSKDDLANDQNAH